MALQKIDLKAQSKWTNIDIDNALNLKVNNTWNESISWVKTFTDNVWINVANPTEKLDISWNIKLTSNFIQLSNGRNLGNMKNSK